MTRTRIGVVVPSTNTTCEADFQSVAPRDVTIHGQRMWLTNDATDESGMERMNAEIENSARYLATAGVNLIVYGCTTGSFYKGPGWDKEMIALFEREAGVPAIGTSPAVVQALQHFNAKKISVASPYPEWANVRLRSYFENMGFDVLNVDGDPVASDAGNQGYNDQHPERVVEFASSVCSPEADVLFCSCTAWRSMEAAEALENETGRPVVTSNQATVWAAFDQLGIQPAVTGFGSLLSGLMH